MKRSCSRKMFATVTTFAFVLMTSLLHGQNSETAEQAESITIDRLLDLVARESPNEKVANPVNAGDEEMELVPPSRPEPQPAEVSDFVRDKNDEQENSIELTGTPVERGPIHEAFAEPIQNTPTAPEVIMKAPPATVQEIPPELPEGRNMVWVPGYWAWDPQGKDYIWVSGVWRKQPKDRTWVAGSWEEVRQANGKIGFQWTPGAWLPVDVEGHVVEKQVLPLPPKSLEQGPATPAPTENHFWIPGVWQRNDNRYAWRPGYWARSHENWVWVPDRYVWDTNGCIYVPGYWDYTWERRGTLYAPCTFALNTPARTISYRPTRIIDTNQWLVNLWVGPRSNCFYFGDYYDFTTVGYTPWYRYYGANRGYYDPFYSYYRWRFPTTYGIGLYGYLNGLHTYYGRNAARRPTISIYGYDTWSRLGRRGYASPCGDVRNLVGLIGSNSIRSYRDYYDPFYSRDRYRGYGRNNGPYVYDYRDRQYGRRDGEFARNRDRNGTRGNIGLQDDRSRLEFVGPTRRINSGNRANGAELPRNRSQLERRPNTTTGNRPDYVGPTRRTNSGNRKTSESVVPSRNPSRLERRPDVNGPRPEFAGPTRRSSGAYYGTNATKNRPQNNRAPEVVRTKSARANTGRDNSPVHSNRAFSNRSRATESGPSSKPDRSIGSREKATVVRSPRPEPNRSTQPRGARELSELIRTRRSGSFSKHANPKVNVYTPPQRKTVAKPPLTTSSSRSRAFTPSSPARSPKPLNTSRPSINRSSAPTRSMNRPAPSPSPRPRMTSPKPSSRSYSPKVTRSTPRSSPKPKAPSGGSKNSIRSFKNKADYFRSRSGR